MKERRFYNRFGNEMSRTATHIYVRPHPCLRPFVAHYTFMEQTPLGAPPFLTLVPDASGCLVLTEEENRLSGLVYGATTKTVTVRNERTGRMRFFVEFWPGGLGGFLPEQTGLTDRRLGGLDVCPTLFFALFEAVEAAQDFDDLVQKVDGLLLRAITQAQTPALLDQLVRTIRQTGGALSVEELSRLSCYSGRHLNRLFTGHMGLGIKSFSRVVRLNTLMRWMKEDARPCALLAQEAGFFDQSHLIREFRALCAMTPEEYRAGQERVYLEPVKFG